MIKFKSINVEDENNEYYIEKYQLYTKSLIISELINGEEKSWKNLDKIWILIGDEEKYIEYIKTELNNLING